MFALQLISATPTLVVLAPTVLQASTELAKTDLCARALLATLETLCYPALRAIVKTTTSARINRPATATDVR